MKNTRDEINQPAKDARCLKLFERKIKLIYLGKFKHWCVSNVGMEADGQGPNSDTDLSPEVTQPRASTNPFQAYYPTQTPTPTFSNKLGGITEHPLSKQVVDFVKQKNVIYAIAIGAMIISAVVIIFMIPQSTEPIEGTWIKGDGQEFTFGDDNSFSNQIYPGSTYTLEGDYLVMTSLVQIIDENQLITKSIVQTVEVSFSDDENAMWWVWKSVTIDNELQQLDVNSCSLLISTSVAKNTFEFGVNAPDYQSDKPIICQ